VKSFQAIDWCGQCFDNKNVCVGMSTCDALVVDLQVLAGSWTTIDELIAVDAHNTP